MKLLLACLYLYAICTLALPVNELRQDPAGSLDTKDIEDIRDTHDELNDIRVAADAADSTTGKDTVGTAVHDELNDIRVAADAADSTTVKDTFGTSVHDDVDATTGKNAVSTAVHDDVDDTGNAAVQDVDASVVKNGVDTVDASLTDEGQTTKLEGGNEPAASVKEVSSLEVKDNSQRMGRGGKPSPGWGRRSSDGNN
eukprot:JP447175.1.p2 GENE.JP447175.1~~JP447175.1.p2  ORF type:complete len:198 (+),score=58.10 JP447175.1:25-618(+)